MLICEKPLQAMIEGFPYLSAEYRMYQAHEKNDWFYDQGKRPF